MSSGSTARSLFPQEHARCNDVRIFKGICIPTTFKQQVYVLYSPVGVVRCSVLPSLLCLYIHAALRIGCATSVLRLNGARCNAADHQIDLNTRIYCHPLSGAFAFSHCSRTACVQSIFSPRTEARCNRVRPSLSRAFAFAPTLGNVRTISALPKDGARLNEVHTFKAEY